jgi:hypothetical protein
MSVSIKKPILISGLPRSGTTWVGNILSFAHNIEYLFEPDNEKHSPIAWAGKQKLHRFPYLAIDDQADIYHKLWELILYNKFQKLFSNKFTRYLSRILRYQFELSIGDRTGYNYIDDKYHNVSSNRGSLHFTPTTSILFQRFLSLVISRDKIIEKQKRQRIVKSVHSSLCLEWLNERFDVKVVVILRNPHSIFASYKRMKLPDSYRNLIYQETLQRDANLYFPKGKCFIPNNEDCIAYQISLMYKILEAQISRNPNWILISHDRLCFTPNEIFKSVYKDLKLDWSEEVNQKIIELNLDGSGFAPKRISYLQPTKWESELSLHEKQAIERWVDYFELDEFIKQYIFA